MSLTADSIFSLLATADFGVYAVSLDQTILFWNRAAEGILGYQREQVLGRRCYDVLTAGTPGGLTAECRQGCPPIRSWMAGRVPAQTQLRMVCASGERKLISLTPMVIADTQDGAPLMAYLFSDGVTVDESDSPAGSLQDVPTAGDPYSDADERTRAQTLADYPALTGRELQVLQMVSRGWETPRIADLLGISPHTVLNHIRHFRRKLRASTKLDAVVTAIRLGILPIS